ncbi:hypothetical protein K438DRAFT_1766165 [Mycena galopus ATCC 62051]|nr:hypothetical protein K438DRAFT_1766165 [Mycena galopus ATCC 62051]
MTVSSSEQDARCQEESKSSDLRTLCCIFGTAISKAFLALDNDHGRSHLVFRTRDAGPRGVQACLLAAFLGRRFPSHSLRSIDDRLNDTIDLPRLTSSSRAKFQRPHVPIWPASSVLFSPVQLAAISSCNRNGQLVLRTLLQSGEEMSLCGKAATRDDNGQKSGRQAGVTWDFAEAETGTQPTHHARFG